MRRSVAVVLALALAHACGTPSSRPTAFSTPSEPGRDAIQVRVSAAALPIVDRWAEAIGGRDGVRAFGGWHAKGAYTRGGVTGTIEIWQSLIGERREVLELGILREERVWSGTRGWFVDRNREVRPITGFERDDMVANIFFWSWSPLLVEREAGSVEVDPTDPARLVLSSRGKRADTLSFDAQTHLPTQFVRRDGEKLRTTTLADWRAVDGVRVPFSITEDNGNPNDAVVIAWTTFERHVPDQMMFVQPKDRPSDATLAASPLTVPIEVVYGGLIFVTARINDVPMSFVLDTGAEATVLNSSRLKKLGLTPFGKFATGAGGGDVELTYVKGVTTKVGDPKTGEAVIRDQIVAAVLLDALEAPLQRPLDGILGYDFISRFVLEIDYKNQTLTLHDRAKYVHKGTNMAQSMTLEDSTPFITAAIEVPGKGKLDGRFVLDTGCLCDVQLFSPFVDTHELLKAFPDAKQAGYSAGAGGETHEVTATIPSLTIGDRVIDKPRADMSRDTHGAGADPESAGLVGSIALGRFVLVLDYKRQQFFLDPQP